MKNLLAALLLVTSTCYGQGIPVLEFHHVVTDDQPKNDTVIGIATFTDEMTWLHDNGYVTITAADLAGYMLDPAASKFPASSKLVVITFDDGLSDQLNAAPVLKDLGFTATFNIISSAPGKPTAMTWDEIRDLSNQGFDIESHSVTHPERMDDETATMEIVDSKKIIEQHIHKPVKLIAWPNGFFTRNMIAIANRAGYIGALTIDQSWCQYNNEPLDGWLSCDNRTGNSAFQNPFLMKRIFIDGQCSVDKFAEMVTEGHTTDCHK